jgi:ATP synthase protein I
VTAATLPGLRRVAFKVVLAQAALTVLASLVCYLIWGTKPGISVLAGGGIGTIANWVLMVLAFRREHADVAALVRAFYVGEMAKIGVTIVLFIVALTTLKEHWVPGYLFAGFVATFLVHMLVMPRAMRRLDSV